MSEQPTAILDSRDTEDIMAKGSNTQKKEAKKPKQGSTKKGAKETKKK
jgi:hypothetical protein